MISRQRGLLPAPAAGDSQVDDAHRERERLRRELLKRIVDRETRRQAARGPTR
jgi:hypothetical protein